jgi:hypothetical protein
VEVVWDWAATPGVGLGVGVIGILLAVLSLWRARQYESKTLDWRLRTNEPILGIGVEHLGSDLSVTWNGERLENPRLITLTIVNSGHREIAADDYTKPLSICVPDVARIVTALITSAPGGDLNPEEHSLEKLDCGNEVLLKPKLLNRGESMDIRLIVDGGRGRPEISARFSGQSRPPRLVQTTAPQGRQFVVLFGIASLLAAYLGAYIFDELPPLPRLAMLAAVVALFAVFAMVAYRRPR